MFFTRSQSAALLMLASGSMVATSVPFCLRMVSTVTAVSPALSAHQGDWPPRRKRGPFTMDWQCAQPRSSILPAVAGPSKFVSQITQSPRLHHYSSSPRDDSRFGGEGGHGITLSVRAGGEPPRVSAPKRCLRRGPHLHVDMLGWRNNQNERGRATKLCSRTTHYPWRCNPRYNFGRTDPLARKLKGSGG